jgi:hypothetical protein
MKIRAYRSTAKELAIQFGAFFFLVAILTGGLVRILTATPGGM